MTSNSAPPTWPALPVLAILFTTCGGNVVVDAGPASSASSAAGTGGGVSVTTTASTGFGGASVTTSASTGFGGASVTTSASTGFGGAAVATGTCTGGGCGDTSSDPANCGACGHSCLGDACEGGACQPFILASGQAPAAIAIDADTVYWTNFESGMGSVWRVPKAGGTSAMVAEGGTFGSYSIAVDATQVFWVDPLGGGLFSAPKGGGAAVALGTGVGEPYGVATDGVFAYVGVIDTDLVRVPAMGGPVDVLADGGGYLLAVDATNVYVTTWDVGLVFQIPKGGGPAITLAKGLYPDGVTVGGGYVYFTDATSGTLSRVPIGGGPTTVLASDASESRVAVDATFAYWTNIADGNVRRVPLGGGAVTVIAGGQPAPRDIAVDDVAIYWTTDGGTIVKLVK